MKTDLSIKVDRVTLLETLKANRKKHEDELVKATEGWKNLLLAELAELSAAVEAGKSEDFYLKNGRPPESHISDYDTAIGMLEMATDTEIELDSALYEQFVLDDWGWKELWTASNSQYINK